MAPIENKLFYVGVTNDINQRTFDHKNATFEIHVGKLDMKQLVWFENTRIQQKQPIKKS